MVRNPLRRQKKLILHDRRRDRHKRNPWEHIPSTSTALSDTRSVADEASSNRKEADETIEFEPLATSVKCETRSGEPIPYASCHASGKPVCFVAQQQTSPIKNDFLWTQGAREEELLAHRSIYKNTGEYISKAS